MIEKIQTRYSCRQFTEEKIKKADLNLILECARWSPSGKNIQSWRFVIIEDTSEMRQKLSELTKSGYVIKKAPINIIVLLSLTESYDRTKNIQGIGACIENMLIAAHTLGYGTCWIGQILNNSSKVLELLELNPSKYELMAVIALGVPKNSLPINRKRIKLSELIIKRYNDK
ncbi:MAG: nitroreductase family protein [Promethearchaeota archaeon]